MPAPRRPASTSDVMTGPISLKTDSASMLGSTASAPKRTSVPLLCMARTTPIENPVTAVSMKLFVPASSIWLISSRTSYGRRQNRLKNSTTKEASSPVRTSNALKAPASPLRVFLNCIVEPLNPVKPVEDVSTRTSCPDQYSRLVIRIHFSSRGGVSTVLIRVFPVQVELQRLIAALRPQQQPVDHFILQQELRRIDVPSPHVFRTRERYRIRDGRKQIPVNVLSGHQNRAPQAVMLDFDDVQAEPLRSDAFDGPR